MSEYEYCLTCGGVLDGSDHPDHEDEQYPDTAGEEQENWLAEALTWLRHFERIHGYRSGG